MFFFGVLGVLLAAVVYLRGFAFRSGGIDGVHARDEEENPVFRAFRRNFLLVYLLMTAADWMQGAYVYELYKVYGYPRTTIGFLFVVGFGSSFICSLFVGSLIDRYGRKMGSLMYCVLYGASCFTKHFGDNYTILLAGRVLGGGATSLLFSTFESWLVHEHRERNFSAASLSRLFGSMTFWNSVVAIVSGMVAYVAAKYFGTVAPFDVALLLLMVGLFIIQMSWTENYGDHSGSSLSNFKGAVSELLGSPSVWLLGLVQSFFEAAMYIFVFLWTPSLADFQEGLPHGIIFSSFMVACMIGSTIFQPLKDRFGPNWLLWGVCISSCFCFILVSISTSITPIYFSFIGFEIAVGIFWPTMGGLRSEVISDGHRGAILNFFRLILNLLVLIVLVDIDSFTVQQLFLIIAFFTLSAATCQLIRIHYYVERNEGSSSSGSELLRSAELSDIPDAVPRSSASLRATDE